MVWIEDRKRKPSQELEDVWGFNYQKQSCFGWRRGISIQGFISKNVVNDDFGAGEQADYLTPAPITHLRLLKVGIPGKSCS